MTNYDTNSFPETAFNQLCKSLTGEDCDLDVENTTKDVAKKKLLQIETEKNDILKVDEDRIRTFPEWYDGQKQDQKPNENQFQTVEELLRYID